jgi:hypothetical protein
VDDTKAPVITPCPPAADYECSDTWSFPTNDWSGFVGAGGAATDNCDTGLEASYTTSGPTGTCPKEWTLTWTVTDDCGNTDTCDQTITEDDTTDPDIVTCPPDTTHECSVPLDGQVPAEDWKFPSPTLAGFIDAGGEVTDNCDSELEATYDIDGPSGSCPTVWILTWTVTDDCGNTATCDQRIEADDTTPPEITACPTDLEFDGPNYVVYPDDSWTGFVNGGGAATDNCDTELEASYTVGDPQGECPTIIVLTWTVVDDCENTDTCEQTITVKCPGEFCTYTQGAWGSGCPASQQGRPYSTQPGCIRDHFFDEVFPDGVTIGVQGVPGLHYAHWADAAAVQDFLPAGTTPSYLTADLPNNPTSTPAGVLAGQILTLRLNMAFSCEGVFDELDLLPEVGCFAQFVIPSDCGSTFAGMRVDAFLAMADSAVAGFEGYRGMLSKFNFTATCLNEMFDECGQPTDEVGDGPYDRSSVMTSLDNAGNGTAFQLQTSIPEVFMVEQSYPNPFSGNVRIGFGLPTNGWVKIDIFDVAGRHVAKLLDEDQTPGYHRVMWNGQDSQGRRVAPGVYFYRVSFQGKSEIKKMMVVE